MLISVVTISFNQGKYLPRCIQSVVKQSYKDYEYIIIDAGSTDNSRNIIDHYQHFFAKKIFESDDGPADGLNKGFSHATGEIFFYLNADDEIDQHAFRVAANFFKSHPTTDVILGNGYHIDRDSKIIRRIYSSPWNTRHYAAGLSNAIQQSTFFRRSAFYCAGGFNVENRTCWDGELLVDMALKGSKIDLIDNYIGKFRIYAESITGSGRLKAMVREDRLRIAKKILNRPPDWRELILHYGVRAFRVAHNPRRTLDKISYLLSRTRKKSI